MNTALQAMTALDRTFKRKTYKMAAEFVTPGHPDKICDQMADAIVDAAIDANREARVAMEVTGGHGVVVVIGEMNINPGPNRRPETLPDSAIATLVQQTYRDIGHDHELREVKVHIVPQSPNIDAGVTATQEREQGAGDQGIMVGYAIDDSDDFMPKTWSTARSLCLVLGELRANKTLNYLKPDGKSQVTIEGDRVVHVTLAAHHGNDIDPKKVEEDLLCHVVHRRFPHLNKDKKEIVINGCGVFEQGGFQADAGTTGRKLMVDNYGPNVEIGGGAYSGKDPSKVDRTGAYFCRMVAKSIVAGQHAREAIVKVGFAIGKEQPTIISIETDLDADRSAKLERLVREKFDFRPNAMVERLDLLARNGWRYMDTAASGHYGNSRFPWEKVVEI